MNKKDYRELVGFLGRRFDEVDKRFDKVDEHFNRVDRRLERLEETKADKADVEKIVERIAERKKNEILDVIDAYAKRADDQWQEHTMLIGQVSRHERWIEKLAKNTDTKLGY